MKIFVAHGSNLPNFRSRLYAPLRDSALNTRHQILLPQDGEKFEEITKEMIRTCDAVVAEVSTPSLGAGIEMGWADAFGVPVIAMWEQGAKPSQSIDNVVTTRFEYGTPTDMIAKLTTCLRQVK